MKDLLAAERYAGALFQIARERRLDEAIEEELLAFSKALRDSAETRGFFMNPYFKISEKRKWLERIYPASRHESCAILVDFFTILFEQGRFNLIHEIAESFKKIADAAQGQALAEIRTAFPMDARTEARLVSRLESVARCKITVKKEVDPSLIGGVAVRLRNKVLDGSLKYGIEKLKKELIQTGTF